MIQFDLSIYFQMGGEKPPTSSEPWFKRRDFGASKTPLVWVFFDRCKTPAGCVARSFCAKWNGDENKFKWWVVLVSQNIRDSWTVEKKTIR